LYYCFVLCFIPDCAGGASWCKKVGIATAQHFLQRSSASALGSDVHVPFSGSHTPGWSIFNFQLASESKRDGLHSKSYRCHWCFMLLLECVSLFVVLCVSVWRLGKGFQFREARGRWMRLPINVSAEQSRAKQSQLSGGADGFRRQPNHLTSKA
jgi:hypothetical protein